MGVCTACCITQPKGALHCEYCQVRIAGYDHHCPWMSKCIGEESLQAFYSFLCISFSSLAYVVAASVMAPIPGMHHGLPIEPSVFLPISEVTNCHLRLVDSIWKFMDTAFHMRYVNNWYACLGSK